MGNWWLRVAKTRNRMLMIVGILIALATLAFINDLGIFFMMANAFATELMLTTIYGYERPMRRYQRVIVAIGSLVIGLYWVVLLGFLFLYLRQFI